MKYLKLRLTTRSNRLIYEKDIDVHNAFEQFIRAMVAILIKDGTIQEGEHFTAIIIPRYSKGFRRSPILKIDADKTAERSEWIEMQLEESSQPEQPVAHFAVELRIQERNMIYRRDFRTIEIMKYYVAQVSQALYRLGVLRSDQVYSLSTFVRDDDQAQFNREHIPELKKRAADLIELPSE